MTTIATMTAVLTFAAASAASAQNIDVSTLPGRDTVQLTIYNSADLTLVLVGGPSLLTRLRQYRPLAERVGVTALLRALGRAETEEYVRHRMRAAGRSEDAFTQDAFDRLFVRTSGVPRRINRICDLALLVGFAERLKQITADEIDGVADELTVGLAA